METAIPVALADELWCVHTHGFFFSNLHDFPPLCSLPRGLGCGFFRMPAVGVEGEGGGISALASTTLTT